MSPTQTLRPLLFLLAPALLLTGCSKHTPATGHAPAALPTASVRVAPATRGTQAATEEVVGTVRAKLRTLVEAKVSGRVEQLPVITGQRVKTGDLLVQLDAREIRARLDQAVALRDQANNDLRRFQSLLAQEAVTRAEFDAVQARQRVADAAVTETETLLAYTRVTAPFDGVVVRKYADLGDLAAPGKPLLEVEDPTHLRLEANVPEALIERVALGDKLRVRIATLDRDLEGAVAEIAPSADPNSRTFLAKIDLPADAGLRAGQFGRAAIALGEFAALRVPASSVVLRGQLELAFVVRDQRALLRLVKTGKRIGDQLEIVSGIDTNEVVVTEGAATLTDGQPVQVQP